jgi:short subunit dehydrogenase-like uncharacterized protein
MLYGAYGFTGRLIVEQAVKSGLRPVLAGRDEVKLAQLADRYSLDHQVIDLEDQVILTATVANFDLVFHAAGPFVYTARPMIRACLDGQAHYLDITGELPVFDLVFDHQQEAQERRVALISGMGFDVVPSDCLANYVAVQVPGAKELEIAIVTLGNSSGGTAKTFLEMLPQGGRIRRDGHYVALPYGEKTIRVPMPNGRIYTAAAVPWGDLATGYRSTGIPNITTYLALPRRWIGAMGRTTSIGAAILSRKSIRKMAQAVAGVTMTGPDENARRTGRSYLWARANDGSRNIAEAWLETAEAYQLTAVAAVSAVKKILAGELAASGALTPAQAFGADFVLELENSRRFDSLTK